MLKTYASKLEDQQIEALKRLSSATKVPQAELLRQAVDLLLEKRQAEQERLEFLRHVDEDLEEDREVMEHLSRL